MLNLQGLIIKLSRVKKIIEMDYFGVLLTSVKEGQVMNKWRSMF